MMNFSKIMFVSRNYMRHYSVESKELVVEKLTEKYSGVTVIGMNRPEKKNALGLNLVNKLELEVERLNSDEKARILIIRSLVDGVFCSGADLKERSKMTNHEITLFLHKLKSVTNKIQNLCVPVIAAMDGSAFGGGLELALACDLRIASRCTKLGLVETKLAIIPGAGGTQRLPRLVNPAIAKELIFTGRVLDGKQAEDLGMVNHAVEQNTSGNSAYMKSLELCEEILQNGPVALKMAKLAINRGLETNIDTGMAIETACYAQLIPTKDRIEALEAFQNKRKPNFRGK
ncbi:methylglutaconyl-CoA hydratase, mitochondrial [Coccinella septempunctata]|uniref:methylglutaconyl-CoA hydratase, mitochondrial n=1 Tax=Coccinella septempunctata TaxID=41139 RepID=UPI001D05ED9E|nr:methylglutaconyl-CoA hydratase, mitochondrial [Coccinella septempunctata]